MQLAKGVKCIRSGVNQKAQEPSKTQKQSGAHAASQPVIVPIGGAGVFVNQTELRLPNPQLPYCGRQAR